MNGRTVCVGLFAASALALAACRGGDARGDASARARGTAEQLLALHHLLGRQPESLAQEEKDAPVDPKALDALILDRGAFDPFVGDLYVGFVVGALARHQGRWITTVEGGAAAIQAGDVRVQLAETGGAWKIDLAASIPGIIKQRAAEEKKSYDAAKAAGNALR
jgi:hypothetical protein